MKTWIQAVVGVLMAMFIGIALVAIPWAWLWSIEVLFGHHVPFGFKTWFAALLFLAILRPAVHVRK